MIKRHSAKLVFVLWALTLWALWFGLPYPRSVNWEKLGFHVPAPVAGHALSLHKFGHAASNWHPVPPPTLLASLGQFVATVPATHVVSSGFSFRRDCTARNNSSGVTSTTVLCGTTTTGDTLVIAGAEWNSSGGTITPSCSDGTNTYTVLHAANATFYCIAFNITGLATDTVTVSFTASTNISIILGQEFSGPSTAGVDVSAFNNSITSCTACTMPAVTTTQANDLILTEGGNASTNNTFSAGTGFTISTNGQVSGGNQSGAVEYEVVTTATTYTPVLNITTAMAITGYTVAIHP